MPSYDEFDLLFHAAQRQGGFASATFGAVAAFGLQAQWTPMVASLLVGLVFLAASMRADDKVRVWVHGACTTDLDHR